MRGMNEEKGRRSPHRQEQAALDGAARRGRYVAAALGTIIVLWLVNVWPGWQAVPFLDSAASQVLGLFNASMLISLAVNLANVAVDGPWVRAAGKILTACAALAVFTRLWTAYPFDFGTSTSNGDLVVRTVLILACAGCTISILVQFVALFRLALGQANETQPVPVSDSAESS